MNTLRGFSTSSARGLSNSARLYTKNAQFGSKSIRNYATYRRFNNQLSNSNFLYDPTFRRFGLGFLAVSGLFYVTHLEEAPVSGRRRFIWVSKSFEKRIGDYTYNELLAEHKKQILPDFHPEAIRVKRIFQKILKVSPDRDNSDIDWKIHIINDPKAPPNAFVLPSGKVFVFSSILPICANDDGLATVLSHEYAHQLARHTSENLSKTPIYGIIGLVLYTITGADLLNSLIVNAVFKMPASREMETEADYIGLMLMSEACFNPQESTRLWERMSNYEKRYARGVQMEFLSTHPGSARRIDNMRTWLPEAEERRARSHCDEYSGFLNYSRDILF